MRTEGVVAKPVAMNCIGKKFEDASNLKRRPIVPLQRLQNAKESPSDRAGEGLACILDAWNQWACYA